MRRAPPQEPLAMNDNAASAAAQEAHDQARLLAEALPYMQRYENKTIVVKYGGHAMGDPALGQAFARDIALLKQSGVNPIVVHGGGPQIGQMLDQDGHQERVQGRPARHRQGDRRDRRDGSRRLHQQGDRRAHQRGGRMGDRALRQGRQHGLCREGAEDRRSTPIPISSRCSTSASSASRSRSTARCSTCSPVRR